jgi:urease accessory protein
MKPTAFLAALHIADSSLPIGRFVHSGGLEAFLRENPGADESAIAELVESVVLGAIGPLDAVVVAESHRAAGKGDLELLLELDRRLTARKLALGSRLASASCGRRLAVLVPMLTERQPISALAELARAGHIDGNLAVIEGALMAAIGIPREEAVLLELRSAAAALLSAIVRLGRLSAVRAQAVLYNLQAALVEAADEADGLSVGSMRSVAPELEVYTLAQQRAANRHFAT